MTTRTDEVSEWIKGSYGNISIPRPGFLKLNDQHILNLALVSDIFVKRGYDKQWYAVVVFAYYNPGRENPAQDWYKIETPEAKALMAHFGLKVEEES